MSFQPPEPPPGSGPVPTSGEPHAVPPVPPRPPQQPYPQEQRPHQPIPPQYFSQPQYPGNQPEYPSAPGQYQGVQPPQQGNPPQYQGNPPQYQGAQPPYGPGPAGPGAPVGPGGPGGPYGYGPGPYPPAPKRGLPAWVWWVIGGGAVVIIAILVVLALLLAAALAPRSNGAEPAPAPTPVPSQGESVAPPPSEDSAGGVLPLDAYYQVDGAPAVSVALPEGWTQVTFDEEGVNAWSNDAIGCNYSVESIDFDASNTAGGGTGDLPSTRAVALDDIDRFGEQLSNTAIVGDNGRATVPTDGGDGLELLVTTMAYTSATTDGPAGLYSGLRVAAQSDVLINLLLTCDAATLQSADNPWVDLVSRTVVGRP
ncbi:hypothetical protein ACL9RL_05320 [Plantibacter sp. Mn2098]|uniref:hypothetical protein n=1 Tax=Plantibacter sp. Mn2098 TaxID=3395266 RepID=UPI003BE696D3